LVRYQFWESETSINLKSSYISELTLLQHKVGYVPEAEVNPGILNGS